MFQRDDQDRIYYVARHIGDLVEMVGCRINAVHSGSLGEREGLISFVKYHARARLWEVAFQGDTPTLNLLGDEHKKYEWRVFDDRIKCSYCGASDVHTHFVAPIGERMRRFKVCYKCDAWLNIIGSTWKDRDEFKPYRRDVPGGGMRAPNWVERRLPDLVKSRKGAPPNG